ncbi:glycoside hydrolase family 32 protein [Oscillospiraceae bacterium 42-9]
MSTPAPRDFRPALHYTPQSGWINDPNGLVYAKGQYHLFAQYYHEPVWGPMHWAHAVSRDLLHWEHLPIALAPDDLGAVFSGSAVFDQNNTSGLGREGQAPLVALYTSHGDFEQQSLAYSLDGVHFEKYSGNPVIPNQEQADFRDPKVFWNPVKSCWSLVLAAGDHVEFFASPDLLHWTKTGVFGPQGNYAEGVWECPDFFPLAAPDGREVWVLLLSNGPCEANHGSRTQYFTGSFNGETFTADGRFTQPEFIDSGYDNYAGVTFFGPERRLLVGWAANWVYAAQTPTGVYCNQMTLPRALTLADTPKGGLRLACAPVEGGAFGPAVEAGPLPGEVFHLRFSGQGAGSLCLRNEQGEELAFGVDERNQAFVDRSRAGLRDFDENFARDWYSRMEAPRLYDGPWTLDLYFDHSVCELFLDQGTRAFTFTVYPSAPYTVAGP